MINNIVSFQGFGYFSPMKNTANKLHTHCAYGGEQFTDKHRATAEHLYPDSHGGDADDANFLPVCAEHNNARGNRSLKEFLKDNPETQKNVEDCILELSRIENDQFNGKQWAKQIKKTFEYESDTKLNLDETGTHRTKETVIAETKQNKEKDTPQPAFEITQPFPRVTKGSINRNKKLNYNA